MPPIVLVALGGALGSAGRYGLGQALHHGFPGPFPIGTLVVNLLGSFAMGVLAGVVAPGTALYFLLGVGALGGFTTYAAFNQETLGLLQGDSPGLAFASIAATLVGGLALGALGLVVGRLVFGSALNSVP